MSEHLFMKQQEKLALEIYLTFKDYPGAYSSVSGYLKRNDSTKISRQLNPNDDRRDHPYIEVDEIQEALLSFSPDLEEAVWNLLEQRRNSRLKKAPKRNVQIAELIKKVFPELSDVVFCNTTNASHEEMEREAFQLLKAVEAVYEEIKNRREK